ncbi:MAG: HIT family protein [Treponema sp.]|nr:HIT family protein [Treponema sp.]MCQ2597868.1 HIT family protein [Treponema sp.]
MCLICDRIQMIKKGENPFFVKELETGYVVIGDNQYFKGYTLFLHKEHKTELFQLDPKTKAKYLEEMALVGEACSRAFGAEKMNYELLGMGDQHVHWHLFPRNFGDLGEYGVNGNGPVWWLPRDKMWSEDVMIKGAELEELKSKLARELDLLFK